MSCNEKKLSTPNNVTKGDLRGWREGKWGGEARKQRQRPRNDLLASDTKVVEVGGWQGATTVGE
jgi:hypothetical protein